MQTDHGYNATPVWTALGGTLANLVPVTDGGILALRLLDPLLLAGMWTAVALAFGWRAACVALLFWGTNYPAQYGWVGGSFLRQLDLAAPVSGLRLRRRRPPTAGALLPVAASACVFPAVALPRSRAAWRRWLRRLRLAPAQRRCARGARHRRPGASSPARCRRRPGPGRPSSRAQPRASTRRCATTGSSIASPSTPRRPRAPRGPEPRRPLRPLEGGPPARVFERRRALFYAGVAGSRSWRRPTRRAEDWSATILALGLVPVALELTCYYASILVAYACLGALPWIGAALCALSASGWWIATAGSSTTRSS
jgi:hypothetical protein